MNDLDMNVRRLFVAVAIGALVVFPTAPASALCMVEPFDHVLRRSDTAWWGTVTDATVSGPNHPGTWTLTVHVDEVLKGQGTEGGTGTVFTSVCGIFVSPEGARDQAAHFVGQTRLYMGNYQHEGVVAFGEIFTPQGMSPRQQYGALDDLGQSVPVPSSGSAVPPTDPVPPGRVATGGSPWIAAAAVAAIIVVGGALMILRRRRVDRDSIPPG